MLISLYATAIDVPFLHFEHLLAGPNDANETYCTDKHSLETFNEVQEFKKGNGMFFVWRSVQRENATW